MSALDDLGGESVSVTTWIEAEQLAARHMVLLGFDDARVTSAGKDGGIDVFAQRSMAAAQVKFHAMPVGAPDVQRLRGAAHAHSHALFYSAAGYTPAALQYAQTAAVALFAIGPWSSVTAVNAAARELFAASPGQIDVGSPNPETPIDPGRCRLEHRVMQILIMQDIIENFSELVAGVTDEDFALLLPLTSEEQILAKRYKDLDDEAASWEERDQLLLEMDMNIMRIFKLMRLPNGQSWELPWEFPLPTWSIEIKEALL